MTLRIEPYGLHSKGAKILALHTGILRATHKQVRKHGTFDTIINWGNSERRFPHATYLNDPAAVTIASNKLSTARAFSAGGIPQPAYTTSKEEATRWYDNGDTVVARRLLRGSTGRGIRLYSPLCHRGAQDCERNTGEHNSSRGSNDLTGGGRDDGPRRGDGRHTLIDAPMYTKYIKKADEYRVHVFAGEVIDVQQKRKRQEVPNDEVNYQIRNAHNGWVYCRNNISCPSSVLRAARDAVVCLGLDFGAADIGWNRHSQTACVYEVNTAPGLEGTTVGLYSRAIQQKLPITQGGAYKRRRAR